jgi:GT2 family glycosyltransferase
LERKFPYIKWIFNKTNKGFAGGMNSGIIEASGEVIVMMNPDVRFHNDNIQRAFDYLMSNPNVGLIGPKIVDEKGNIQDSCRRFMTPKELLSRTCARVFRAKKVILNQNYDYFSTQTTDWVIGAFMMVRHDALETVGLLDHKYFLYVEDMDWCKRFWDNGFQVVYYPLLEVIYEGDRKSTSPLISKKLFNKYSLRHMRNYLRFLCKNRFRISRKV